MTDQQYAQRVEEFRRILRNPDETLNDGTQYKRMTRAEFAAYVEERDGPGSYAVLMAGQ
jgi:hypothetical protein